MGIKHYLKKVYILFIVIINGVKMEEKELKENVIEQNSIPKVQYDPELIIPTKCKETIEVEKKDVSCDKELNHESQELTTGIYVYKDKLHTASYIKGKRSVRIEWRND